MIDIYYIIDDLAAKCASLGGVGGDDKKVYPDREADIATGIIGVLAKEGYCHGDGAIMGYDGRRYVVIDSNAMKKILSGLIVKLKIGNVYLVKSVDAIYKVIMQSSLIREFEQQKGIVSLRNVVLDMDTMKTYPHGAQWMTRTYMDVDYDPLATCDWWRRWLTEMVVDADSIAVMQEFFGMAFIDRNRISIESVLFLYGNGGTGKSVVQQVITGLLGDESCDSAELSQICTQDFYAAQVNGKLINFCADMGDKDFSGGRFKAIASHQPVMVCPKYQAPFMARDMPLLAACVNKLPVTTDSTRGHWRRQQIVVFDREIPDEEQDKEYSVKILEAEASGILNWLMEGRTRLLAHKGHFTKSNKIMETVAEARIDSSSVLSWMRDSMYCGKPKEGVPGEEIRRHSADVIEEYREYCHKTGCMPKKNTNLKEDMIQAGAVYEKAININNKTSTGWRIWRIEPASEDMVADAEKMPPSTVNELPF
jgi:putative DNA primase/helicase